ncbi:CehA/McbA family metallohydrolase [Pseudothermotoga thermarum]|nr:CehA/McbA family metallohydrolase [Pseudothermotoga thermarum]
MKIVYSGSFKPSDRLSSVYRLFAFSVPENVKYLEIRYDYDRSQGNVIDLGLFDPRGGSFLSSEGFRGWSGSAKSHVIIAETFATPGYIPGPIIPGVWKVILGLYKINSERCDYTVEILLHDSEISLTNMSIPLVKITTSENYPHICSKTGPAWFKGDLHSHTYHSDAQCGVDELIAAARRRGLDFLAITDHNTVSHLLDIQRLKCQDFCVIPGEEITTYLGHANVWGIKQWFDFRCISQQQIKQLCEEVHRKRLLFSINHPKPGGPEWEFGYSFDFDCMEVWQSIWSRNNEHSLKVWNDLLLSGRRIIAVGGSDSHPIKLGNGIFEWLGYPTTWVYAKDLTVESILEGIRAGHVTISACPLGPFLALEIFKNNEKIAMQGDVVKTNKYTVKVIAKKAKGLILRLLSPQGGLLQKKLNEESSETVLDVDLREHGYVRAELRVPSTFWQGETSIESLPVGALTNPVWSEDFLKKCNRCN